MAILCALAPACCRAPSGRTGPDTPPTVARGAPGFVSAEADLAATYVLREGRVSAWATDFGLALTIPVVDGDRGALQWRLEGARSAKPRADSRVSERAPPEAEDPSTRNAKPLTLDRLSYEDVYPGIDLTVESRSDAVAYRFDLEAGADPSAIRMRYVGAQSMSAARDGRALEVRKDGRTLREEGLTCFQESAGARQGVSCSYDVRRALDGSFEVALVVGPYDQSLPLVIDPEIGWSSYLGGRSDDWARAVAVDSDGNAYVTGETFSLDFPTADGLQPSYGTGGDAFVTKIGPSGSSLVWSSYLGGSSHDEGAGITVDASGNAYVTGVSTCRLPGCPSDFPTVNGFDSSHEGFSDAFVTKVDSTGSMLLWSSFLGGSGDDSGHDVAVDVTGDVYLVGYTTSLDFPTVGGFDTAFGGIRDAYVTKVDATGSSIVWSSYLGGDDVEWGRAIALDSLGNVYVTGETYSTDFPTTGGFDTSHEGDSDAFVTRVDAAGLTLSWSSLLGGIGEDSGSAVVVDSRGNVYVAGITHSSDFPTVGGFDTSLDGEVDAFVAKVDAAGPTLAWSSYLGGEDDDECYDMAVDVRDNLYLTGNTRSSNFPTTGGFDTDLGYIDAFVTRVDAARATVTWSSYLGGSGWDYGNGIAVDTQGSIHVAGVTGSFDVATPGAFDALFDCAPGAPCIEGFVTKIVACGNGECDPAEDSCTCSVDCGSVCGDDCCTGTEHSGSCPMDCFCGDRHCAVDETPCECSEDCGSECGDGCCTGSEDKCGCAEDCTEDVCGDGCCTGSEDKCACPRDCTEDVCGDGCCTGAETCFTCRSDCCAVPIEPPPDASRDGAVEPPPAPEDGSGVVRDGSAGGGGGVDSGCSCRVATSGRSGLLLMLVFPWLLRRRRRPGSERDPWRGAGEAPCPRAEDVIRDAGH